MSDFERDFNDEENGESSGTVESEDSDEFEERMTPIVNNVVQGFRLKAKERERKLELRKLKKDEKKTSKSKRK